MDRKGRCRKCCYSYVDYMGDLCCGYYYKLCQRVAWNCGRPKGARRSANLYGPFKPKPIKEEEDKTYKSLKLFIGPREAHDE